MFALIGNKSVLTSRSVIIGFFIAAVTQLTNVLIYYIVKIPFFAEQFNCLKTNQDIQKIVIQLVLISAIIGLISQIFIASFLRIVKKKIGAFSPQEMVFITFILKLTVSGIMFAKTMSIPLLSFMQNALNIIVNFIDRNISKPIGFLLVVSSASAIHYLITLFGMNRFDIFTGFKEQICDGNNILHFFFSVGVSGYYQFFLFYLLN